MVLLPFVAMVFKCLSQSSFCILAGSQRVEEVHFVAHNRKYEVFTSRASESSEIRHP